jgi:ABC-type Zn uptake system ZnuABC Zn-binding protein ZnuA
VRLGIDQRPATATRAGIGPRPLLVVLIAVGALLVAACGADPQTGSPAAADAVRVVATTTVFADLVEEVGGARVSVTSLVPKGGEVHTFDPTPSDMRAVAEADLIVMNGLGLDDWLGRVVEQTDSKAPVIRLAEGVPGFQPIAGGPGGGAVNPHLWLDLTYARAYVDEIRVALVGLDPSHATAIEARAADLDERLAAEDAATRQAFAAIPESDRRIVSFHDAFPYYARAYGLEILGTVVHAPGQEPSAGEVAALIDEIRADGASAIISEAQFSDELVRTIADETGVVVVSDLYDDTLGDPPVDTFLGMIHWDTERILGALDTTSSGDAAPTASP